MKLNKKGFAFSTMLYGSVAIIIVVLYLILNINKASRDTTYYYGEEVLKDLNNCVTEEIALENCYSSGNQNCDTSPYYICLGVANSSSQVQGVIISETLKENLSNYIGLVEDPYESGRYIFRGEGGSIKNYIEVSGKVWRIVSIEHGGYLKLVDTRKYTTITWDSDGKRIWGVGNSLYNMLNTNYLSTLTDPAKIFQWNWKATKLFPSAVAHYNIGNLIDQENNTPAVDTKTAMVGLLSVSDYLKAIPNDNCIEDVFDLNASSCSSWLSEYKSWTINTDGEIGSDSEGYVYYYGDYFNGVSTYYNKLYYKKASISYDVYPVVFLDRNSVIASGDGSMSTPYKLK